MKPRLKIILGFSIFLFTIGFIILWDTVIKVRIDSVSVAIVRPGVVIEKNTVIHEDMIMVEKRDRGSLIEGVVYEEEIEGIIGYETKQPLYGNSIISKRYIDFEGITPSASKGEAIRPIPNEWIYASPSTLRRKDYIDFYLFKSDEMIKEQGLNQEQNVAYFGLSPEQKLKLSELNEQVDEENKQYQKERESIALDKDMELQNSEQHTKSTEKLFEEIELALEETNDVSVKGEKITVTHQERQRERIMKALGISQQEWSSLVKKGDIPMLVDIPIIYVKDGAGNEIQNGENSTQEERLTATGSISDLEVLMNEDEYRLLKGYMELGYRIYISYN
jgi:hypothetical protein